MDTLFQRTKSVFGQTYLGTQMVGNHSARSNPFEFIPLQLILQPAPIETDSDASRSGRF